jgi:hypothetical protein
MPTNKFKEKIEELFSLIKKEKFADVTLKDGVTILRTEGDLATGVKATIVTQDGAIVPAADNEYELQDGSKVVIKSAVVDSITPAPVATPSAPSTDIPMAAAPVAPTAPADSTLAPSAPADDSTTDDKLAQVIDDLTSRVAALEEKLGEQISANTEMSKTVEKMAAEPGAPAVKRRNIADGVNPNAYSFSTEVADSLIDESGMNELIKFRLKK